MVLKAPLDLLDAWTIEGDQFFVLVCEFIFIWFLDLSLEFDLFNMVLKIAILRRIIRGWICSGIPLSYKWYQLIQLLQHLNILLTVRFILDVVPQSHLHLLFFVLLIDQVYQWAAMIVCQILFGHLWLGIVDEATYQNTFRPDGLSLFNKMYVFGAQIGEL